MGEKQRKEIDIFTGDELEKTRRSLIAAQALFYNWRKGEKNTFCELGVDKLDTDETVTEDYSLKQNKAELIDINRHGFHSAKFAFGEKTWRYYEDEISLEELLHIGDSILQNHHLSQAAHEDFSNYEQLVIFTTEYYTQLANIRTQARRNKEEETYTTVDKRLETLSKERHFRSITYASELWGVNRKHEAERVIELLVNDHVEYYNETDDTTYLHYAHKALDTLVTLGNNYIKDDDEDIVMQNLTLTPTQKYMRASIISYEAIESRADEQKEQLCKQIIHLLAEALDEEVEMKSENSLQDYVYEYVRVSKMYMGIIGLPRFEEITGLQTQVSNQLERAQKTGNDQGYIQGFRDEITRINPTNFHDEIFGYNTDTDTA